MQCDTRINAADREWGHIWRYLRTGKVTHALGAGTYGNALFSRCGLAINLFNGEDWLGTGNQTEYDMVASLPRCKTCIRIVDKLMGR